MSEIETVAFYQILDGGCNLSDISSCALTALLNWNLDSIELIWFILITVIHLNLEPHSLLFILSSNPEFSLMIMLYFVHDLFALSHWWLLEANNSSPHLPTSLPLLVTMHSCSWSATSSRFSSHCNLSITSDGQELWDEFQTSSCITLVHTRMLSLVSHELYERRTFWCYTWHPSSQHIYHILIHSVNRP